MIGMNAYSMLIAAVVFGLAGCATDGAPPNNSTVKVTTADAVTDCAYIDDVVGTSGWYGLFAPKGTPAPVVESIAAAVAQAVKGAAPSKTFESLGAEPLGNKPAEFAAMIRAESQRVDVAAKRYPLE